MHGFGPPTDRSLGQRVVKKLRLASGSIRAFAVLLVLLGLIALGACRGLPPGGKDQPAPGEQLAGGELTVADTTRNAFGHPAPGLSREDGLLFFVGNSFFNQNWVTAPASTTARDGVGPLFNARSCAGCHLRDGRGSPPAPPGEPPALGLLVRLSVPGEGPHGAPLPEPAYGEQLQDQAILGVPPEGALVVSYAEIAGRFADGEPYSLRAPAYSLGGLAYGRHDPALLLSPRVANQIIGLGLLEALPEAEILALADPDDADGDGISGRANYVWDVASGQLALGRFGWKANQPSLAQQTAAAFNGDMGISTPLFAGQNCADGQRACLEAPDGGQPEIAPDDFAKVVLYTSTLGVPARRNWDDAQVLAGRRLFREIGCASCHTPQRQTGVHPRFDALSNQTIWPYTDLLLHDMGPGLADGRPDFLASGSEWRTPPLWGIGLIPTVNGHSFYLHDGRARSLIEAVLWHGGEAEAARQRVLTLSKAERAALIAFLESL
jgi:CxxC motif-containing protein (DUF1111 family)